MTKAENESKIELKVWPSSDNPNQCAECTARHGKVLDSVEAELPGSLLHPNCGCKLVTPEEFADEERRRSIQNQTPKLYGKVDALIGYEKSMMDYEILLPDGFIQLHKLTDEYIYEFFDVFKHRNNVKHNFEVLDRVAKRLMDGLLGGTFGDELSRGD